MTDNHNPSAPEAIDAKEAEDLAPNLEAPDDFYSEFVAIHDSLSDAQSERFNLALIFMLANRVGDRDALARLLSAAKKFTDDNEKF